MPFKFNALRRDKFAKAKYRVTNWAEYNEALRQRGDVTVWLSEDAVSRWRAVRSGKRGGQQRYSDLAIASCLTLRAVFGLPLGQTQGFVRSLLRLMQTDLPVPDFSTLCRRAPSLQIAPDTRTASGPIALVVESTGLRVHGACGVLPDTPACRGHRRSARPSCRGIRSGAPFHRRRRL